MGGFWGERCFRKKGEHFLSLGEVLCQLTNLIFVYQVGVQILCYLYGLNRNLSSLCLNKRVKNLLILKITITLHKSIINLEFEQSLNRVH